MPPPDFGFDDRSHHLDVRGKFANINEAIVLLIRCRCHDCPDYLLRCARISPNDVYFGAGLAEGNIDNVARKPGEPYYNGIMFHRVIPNFMIQGGDPTGTGRGGPGYMFPDEFDPILSFAGSGVLAMANSGPDTNDSQFFITEVPTQHLDQQHMVFGQLISGRDVLEQISEVPTDEDDCPYETVLLKYVEIIDSPQDGTVTIWADGDFDGEGEVTLSLEDGQGNVASGGHDDLICTAARRGIMSIVANITEAKRRLHSDQLPIAHHGHRCTAVNVVARDACAVGIHGPITIRVIRLRRTEDVLVMGVEVDRPRHRVRRNVRTQSIGNDDAGIAAEIRPEFSGIVWPGRGSGAAEQRVLVVAREAQLPHRRVIVWIRRIRLYARNLQRRKSTYALEPEGCLIVVRRGAVFYTAGRTKV